MRPGVNWEKLGIWCELCGGGSGGGFEAVEDGAAFGGCGGPGGGSGFNCCFLWKEATRKEDEGYTF